MFDSSIKSHITSQRSSTLSSTLVPKSCPNVRGLKKEEDSKVSLLSSGPQKQLWKSFVSKTKAWRSASELQLYWTSPVLVQCPEQNADFDSLAREHPIKIVFAWQNKHPLRPDLIVLGRSVGLVPISRSRQEFYFVKSKRLRLNDNVKWLGWISKTY